MCQAQSLSLIWQLQNISLESGHSYIVGSAKHIDSQQITSNSYIVGKCQAKAFLWYDWSTDSSSLYLAGPVTHFQQKSFMQAMVLHLDPWFETCCKALSMQNPSSLLPLKEQIFLGDAWLQFYSKHHGSNLIITSILHLGVESVLVKLYFIHNGIAHK